jgi:hypothetical protein
MTRNTMQRNINVAALQKRIKEFLKDGPVINDGGWTPVTDADISELHEIIGGLLDLKFERDCDSDQTVEYYLLDRNKGSALFEVIPYLVKYDAPISDRLTYITDLSHTAKYLTSMAETCMGKVAIAGMHLKKDLEKVVTNE